VLDSAQRDLFHAVVSKPALPTVVGEAVAALSGERAVQPVHEVAKTPARPRTRADHYAPDIAGARVLLVEDNAINREVAVEMLRAFGLQADSATNGAEAVQKVAAGGYAAVLMDVQMSVMNGFDATRKIRADASLPQPPIIAMTANALSGDRERCLEAGMDDYVSKPIDPASLLAMLRRWIGPRAAAVAPDIDRPQPAAAVRGAERTRARYGEGAEPADAPR
jgi:two-component system, sensor histidine kinase and response regulator